MAASPNFGSCRTFVREVELPRYNAHVRSYAAHVLDKLYAEAMPARVGNPLSERDVSLLRDYLGYWSKGHGRL